VRTAALAGEKTRHANVKARAGKAEPSRMVAPAHAPSLVRVDCVRFADGRDECVSLHRGRQGGPLWFGSGRNCAL